VKQSADDLKSRAEKRARTTLVVDALAEQEKIEIDDEALGNRSPRSSLRAGAIATRPRNFIACPGSSEG